MKKRNRLKKVLRYIYTVLFLTVLMANKAYAVNSSDLANPKRVESTHCNVNNRRGAHTTEFHYVYFGMYPQREISGDEITDVIRNATYDSNGDAVVNGKKYRRLTWETTTTYGTVNEKSKEVHWDPYAENGYRYFLYEPIRWKILNNDGKKLLLFSDQALDLERMNSTSNGTGVSYENSGLRKWLNYDGKTDLKLSYPSYKSKGFMYFAFDSSQLGRILTTHLEEGQNPEFETTPGNAADDKIFLLSYEEMTNPEYGFCNTSWMEGRDYSCTAWEIKDTEFAHALGTYNYAGINYWMRTRGKNSNQFMYCGTVTDYSAEVNLFGMSVSQDNMGVAPALNASYKLSDCIKVTFETNGAGTVENQILLGSGYAKEPAVLSKKNFAFTGWYLDAACTKKYDFNYKLTADTTLYAGWKPCITVIFDTNGATQIAAQSIATGTIPKKPANPVKTDYVFTGWYLDKACTKPYNFDQAMESNTTLYAGWKVRDLKLNEKITSGGSTYQVINSSSKSVQYYSPSKKSVTAVTIPATVSFKGVKYKVTSIRKNAFKNYKKLKKVVIGKNITTISGNSFYGCKKLTTVTFKGNNLKTIGEGAFRNCTSLKKITIPKAVTTIGKNAFRNCKKLNKITIKSTTLKKVGSKAFTNINKKAKFIVPKKKIKRYKKLMTKKTGYRSSMIIKK